MANMTVLVTDISFWQDDPTTPQKVNFAKMAEGAAGVIIRAGQNTWIDKSFSYHWQAAKGILPRGSYFFYDSRSHPKAQAELWVKTLGNDLGEMGLWCDFEERYGGAYGSWRHWYDFMEALRALVPDAKLGVYTGYYYFVEKTALATNAQLSYFAKYPLWIAAYNNTAPKIPPPWKDYKLWQFTDNGKGSDFGVESGNIDLNIYNGAYLDFLNEYGNKEPVTVRLVADYNGQKVEYRSI